MRVLITYFSQTGNTAQVAQAMANALKDKTAPVLKPLAETTPEDLAAAEVIFLGSPVHAGGLARPVAEFLAELPASPGFKLASFLTHASQVYERQGFEKAIAAVENACIEKSITFLGLFDCQGRLAPQIQPAVQKAKGLGDEEWAGMMAQTEAHPSPRDEDEAANFALGALARAQV